MGDPSQSGCGGRGAQRQDYDGGGVAPLSADRGGILIVAARVRDPRPARSASNARSAIPRAPAPAKSQAAPMINESFIVAATLGDDAATAAPIFGQQRAPRWWLIRPSEAGTYCKVAIIWDHPALGLLRAACE